MSYKRSLLTIVVGRRCLVVQIGCAACRRHPTMKATAAVRLANTQLACWPSCIDSAGFRDLSGCHQRMFQKHRARFHACTREQSTTRTHCTAVADAQLVQAESTSRVDVSNHRAIIDANPIAHRDQLWLCQLKRWLATRPDRTVLA